jgi:hypothetical protein
LSIMSLANRRARDLRDKYNYSKLKDAVACVNERVNFYGVVSEYEQPKPTQGTGEFSRVEVFVIAITLRHVETPCIIHPRLNLHLHF